MWPRQRAHYQLNASVESLRRMKTAKIKLATSAAVVPLNGFDQPMLGAEFLLSMVESRWFSRNGNGSNMDSGLKAQQELEQIERQIAHLESAVGPNEQTQRQLASLQERVDGLRREVSSHLSAWGKTELARHPQRPYMELLPI